MIDHLDDGEVSVEGFLQLLDAEFEQLAREMFEPPPPDQTNPREATRG